MLILPWLLPVSSPGPHRKCTRLKRALHGPTERKLAHSPRRSWALPRCSIVAFHGLLFHGLLPLSTPALPAFHPIAGKLLAIRAHKLPPQSTGHMTLLPSFHFSPLPSQPILYFSFVLCSFSLFISLSFTLFSTTTTTPHPVVFLWHRGQQPWEPGGHASGASRNAHGHKGDIFQSKVTDLSQLM